MFALLVNRAWWAVRHRAMRALFEHFAAEKTPEERARRLLREWLSPQQRKQFDAFGHFDVVGGHTGNRYRIVFPR